MSNPLINSKFLATASLAEKEEFEVTNKVKFELANFQHKVVNIGGILNPIAGLFIILTLRNHVNLSYLIVWYTALVMLNAINVYFAYRNRKIIPNQVIQWQKALRTYHIMIALLCSVYGCTGILYTGNDAHYQLFVITFLELLIVGFNIGTVTDIVACSISNIFLLIPYLTWSIYAIFYLKSTTSYNTSMNFSYGITLVILALFFYMATYVAHLFIKKFFRLSYEKVFLSKKLENANSFLEQRVKERTQELQDSLKLVKYQSTHDLLTNLPNQRFLLEALQTAIKIASDKKSMFCVVALSINELEKINDVMGYQSVSSIIKTISKRFDTAFEKNIHDLFQANASVFLSRKDVFVILLNPISTIESLEKKLVSIFSILNDSILFEKQPLKVTGSIGACVYPNDGLDARHLLMNADAAMVHAKRIGGNNINIYKSKINEENRKKLEIENLLYSAIKNNEFTLFYQPIIDLKSGKICSAEALVRWNSPIMGSVPPSDFIPLSEANGSIIPLGEWILRTACKQTKQWEKMGINSIKVAINLSANQLHQKNIVQLITNILKENDLSSKRIELELTERAVFNEDAIPVIKQFKEMNLSLSIDDFGTGYSGLINLMMFEIDKLKIDKCFVQDLTTNKDSRAIVSNTIALAKNINVKVLAEGVESEEQVKFLVENGCDMIQGYYFSKPLNVEDFTVMIKNNMRFLPKR